jgi:3-oxoacyl-[acyl-carrier-protein] synthase-1
MWLLQTLPNNVLGHVGIRHGLKVPNACITNHSVSGMLAIVEATEALREGEADRAVAVSHDSPIEPQTILYCHRIGLLAEEVIRSFDARRDGSVFGEGGASLVLETEASAASHGATVLGEVLGGGSASDAQGLFALREDGAGLADAIRFALEDAQLNPSDVGVVVAHANGTRQSDASEATALFQVFGPTPPPITGFKWAFGHLLAASGIIEAVLAIAALRKGVVPGIATLAHPDPDCAGIRISATAQEPRNKTALILCRGFAGTNAALIVRSF